MKIAASLLLCLTFSVNIVHAGDEPSSALATGDFHWRNSGPLVAARAEGGFDWHAIKDPSVVRVGDKWHVFCTVRGTKRSHAIVHLSFSDWKDAAGAKQEVLTCHDGFFGAPEVFYFEPQQKWYLVCQASKESWEPKYQAAFSTTTDIDDPASWSALQPLDARRTADGKTGLDFWVICDDAKSYLFFTTLDGRFWREETSVDDFPAGWSDPQLALQADIFEASHTYRIRGKDLYLTIIEALNGHGFRYFKAYTAKRLDGEWRPLAGDKEKAFASMANVVQTGPHWTDAVSHGELIRAGNDQRLEINSDRLELLIQGVLDRDREGKKYGEIPWQLGLLEQVNQGRPDPVP